MKVSRVASLWVMAISFFVALVFEIIPLSENLQGFRPNFFYLVIVFWSIYAPVKQSLFLAFFAGFILDVLKGNLLGIHGVILLMIVVFLFVFCQRIKMFELWKQCFLIFCILSVANFLYLISQSFAFSVQEVFLAPLLSVSLWPSLVVILSGVTTPERDFYTL